MASSTCSFINVYAIILYSLFSLLFACNRLRQCTQCSQQSASSQFHDVAARLWSGASKRPCSQQVPPPPISLLQYWEAALQARTPQQLVTMTFTAEVLKPKARLQCNISTAPVRSHMTCGGENASQGGKNVDYEIYISVQQE